MRYLSIKNFAKHQHYKDRNPPWIKLHRSTLSDYAFGCLQDASKAHLMLLWVLASGVDNRIPYDLPWIQKQLGANEPIDVEELILQGFMEVGQDDGKPLASCKQNAPLVEESRVEGEKRKKKPSLASGEARGWPAECSAFWSEKVTPIEPARCGRTLKAVVNVHGWDTTKAALEKFITGSPSWKQPRLDVFANEANRWVGYVGMPTFDMRGEPTEWGLLLDANARDRRSA